MKQKSQVLISSSLGALSDPGQVGTIQLENKDREPRSQHPGLLRVSTKWKKTFRS